MSAMTFSDEELFIANYYMCTSSYYAILVLFFGFVTICNSIDGRCLRFLTISAKRISHPSADDETEHPDPRRPCHVARTIYVCQNTYIGPDLALSCHTCNSNISFCLTIDTSRHDPHNVDRQLAGRFRVRSIQHL